MKKQSFTWRQASSVASVFKYKRSTFMGGRLVVPWSVYPEAKMWVVRLLEVSPWSIRDNYDSLGYQLSVIPSGT